MKKFFLILVFISFALAILPSVASAIEYKFGGLGDNPTPCEYVKALYIWGLGIIGSLAVVGIAFGGFYYMVGKVEQGKEIIYSSLLGLLLLFGAWLILYTINPELAKLKCEKLPAPAAAPSTPSPPSGPSTDQAVRDKLAADTGGKITVNKTCQNSASCSISGGQTCLNGLQTNTTQGVESIQQSCNCSLTITGGTECGHSTSGTYNHSNGYKLDLRPDANIDSYVQQQGCSKAPPDTNCKGADGNTYRYETAGGAHWDVCFKC